MTQTLLSVEGRWQPSKRKGASTARTIPSGEVGQGGVVCGDRRAHSRCHSTLPSSFAGRPDSHRIRLRPHRNPFQPPSPAKALGSDLPYHKNPARITFLKKGMRLPWGGGVVTLLTLVLAEPLCSPSSASSSSNSRGSSSKAKLVISLPGPQSQDEGGRRRGGEK